MQMGRLAWGVVAGIVGILFVGFTYALEMRFFGSLSKAFLYLAFFGGGGAVLWLADRFGLMVRPYTGASLGLTDPPTLPTADAPRPTLHLDLAEPCAIRLADVARNLGLHATATGTGVAVRESVITLSVTIESHDHAQGKSVLAIAVHAHVPGTRTPLTAGSIGIGEDDADAVFTAIDEWATFAGGPIVSAVVGESGGELQLGPFTVHAGPVAIRAPVDPQLPRDIASRLLPLAAGAAATLDPKALHTVSIMAAVGPGAIDAECRVDGRPSESCTVAVRGFAWPKAATSYMYKQFYVLRASARAGKDISAV